MSFARTAVALLAGPLLLIMAMGCSDQAARPTPSSITSPTTRPAVTATAQTRPSPTSVQVARGTANPTAVRQTPAPGQATPVGTSTGEAEPASLALTVLAPADGAQLHGSAVRVLGTVPQDAVVAVNGVPAHVQLDGTFVSDVVLDEDIVGIEISAVDLSGAVASAQLAVFKAATSDELSLDVLYPRDGMVIPYPSTEVVGVSNAGAIVAVNGTPVVVNALGIFSQLVELTEGANFIEVTATDTSGDVKSSGIAVFYAP